MKKVITIITMLFITCLLSANSMSYDGYMKLRDTELLIIDNFTKSDYIKNCSILSKYFLKKTSPFENYLILGRGEYIPLVIIINADKICEKFDTIIQLYNTEYVSYPCYRDSINYMILDTSTHTEIIIRKNELGITILYYSKFGGDNFISDIIKLKSQIQLQLEQEQLEKIARQEQLEKIARQEKQEFIDLQKKMDNKLHVYKCVLNVDSYGGTSFSLNILNGFKKSVKYVTFNVSFYNAVDDRVYSKYSFQNYTQYQLTGYIEPGRDISRSWSGIYNTTAEYYKINNVVVTFKDGTVLYLTKGKNLIID